MSVSAATEFDRRASARERLLVAANELFYAEGIQTVGVDRIIEHAGVAKASLYNVFGSKEELVAAYLASRHDLTTKRLAASIAKIHDPRDKILAVFDAQARQFEQPDFNGCPFVAATTEAPRGGLVERAADDFRASIREMFTDLAEQAGAAHAASLARQLHLLYDGAGLAARMDHHDPGIAPSARAAAESLLAASLGTGKRTSRARRRTVKPSRGNGLSHADENVSVRTI